MTINRDEFLKYYNMGYPDGVIAELIGCSKFSARTIRHRLGLSPNYRVINHSKFMEYYNLGYTDKQIAEQFGFRHFQNIRNYRQKCNLPAHGRKRCDVSHVRIRYLPGYTIDPLLKDYTPSDEDKPWTDPEPLFCDGEFLEKIKSKVVEESH